MQATPQGPSRKAIWTGRALSGVAVLFLLFDAVMKLLAHPEAVKTTTQLGYPASVLFGLGVLQAVCLVLDLVPRTSVLGAILWTGYLGGAVATHVRVGDPLFSHARCSQFTSECSSGLGLATRYSAARVDSGHRLGGDR